ncbi:hypothetical protein HZC32_02260 [Candidatus Woesearchaeota archaeon]|nr:hypothetical protein [Candidatus Woesearchaeota archaeon]
METLNIYIGMFISGLFTGFGVAIANYFANKHLVRRLEAMNKIITKLTGSRQNINSRGRLKKR